MYKKWTRGLSILPYHQYLRGYLSGLKHKMERNHGIRVFSYHGITEKITSPILERNLSTVSDFRQHISFLKHFKVFNTEELLEVIAEKRKVSNGAVITFDDGYKNNLIAGDILVTHNLPAIFFLTCAELKPDGCIWTVELSLLLLCNNPQSIELFDKKWARQSMEQRKSAFHSIRKIMKCLPAEKRKKKMEELISQFPESETACQLEKTPSLKMMDWDQAEKLASAGFEIGSHGKNHEIHHNEQSEAIIQEELSRSKILIETKLKIPVNAFSYPNGDVTTTSMNYAKATGYKFCFTTRQGCIQNDFKAFEAFALPRIEPSGSVNNFVMKYFWKLKT